MSIVQLRMVRVRVRVQVRAVREAIVEGLRFVDVVAEGM
jgi:hypothetical protein